MEKVKAMYSLIEEYYNSGVSARKFAALKGIKLSTFSYWIRRKKQLERKAAYGNFIAVDNNNKASLAPAAELEIVYPNGVRIVSSNFDVQQIQQLVKLY